MSWGSVLPHPSAFPRTPCFSLPTSISAASLLSDFESPAVSEPQLRQVGGAWNEPYVLPIDPELLFQRTGYACMDEDSFPFNSVGAHYDQFPQLTDDDVRALLARAAHRETFALPAEFALSSS